MDKSIISALKGCICHIQLKLSDFFGGEPEIDKVLTKRFIQKDKPRYVDKELILHSNNHFELINPICSACGSHHVTKQGYRERNPILGEFGSQKIYLRRYKCKKCRKKFITTLDPVIEPNHRYATIFKDRVDGIMKTKYRPLRKVKEDLITFLGISPCHQTINIWLRNSLKNDKNVIENRLQSYSGYYCYDEQYIKINGKRMYRLILVDSLLNVPVCEEISNNKQYLTVYSFLSRSLAGKPLYAITTDHNMIYKGIIDRLGANHQLCVFHLFKMIGDDLNKIIRSKNLSNTDKIKSLLYFTEIKEIFRTYDENIAIKRLENLLDNFGDIPQVLQRYMRNKILPDFGRLTAFMRDGLISRTNNPVENYYRQTDPEAIKKKYRTIRGILSYLERKMRYWTVRFGRYIQHPIS